jgi:16S rRNA (guanine966-N2)-methyltransferase
MRIIAGRFRGKHLVTPSDESIRPTGDRVREAIFGILTSRLGQSFEGLRVLDLFAGTGAMGLEALSRGAAGVVLVDAGVEARGVIRDNIEALGAGGVAKLLRRDATALGPSGTMGAFDLIFLDPPYQQGLGEKALVSARDGGWIAPDATIILEESRKAVLALPDGFMLDDKRDYGGAAIYFLAPG